MRKLNYFWTLIIFCHACGGGPTPEPTEAEKQLELLNSTVWVPGSITWDRNNLLEIYPSFEDFEITFSGSLNEDKSNLSSASYTTTDDKIGILPDGTWQFMKDRIVNTLIMNGMEVAYSVSDTTLRLEFNHEPPENSRTNAISGVYVFNLVPKN